jgi:hypothetical protein
VGESVVAELILKTLLLIKLQGFFVLVIVGVFMSIRSFKYLYNFMMLVLTATLIFSTYFIDNREYKSLIYAFICFGYLSAYRIFIYYTPNSDSYVTEKKWTRLKIMNIAAFVIFCLLSFFVLILNAYHEYKIFIMVLEGLTVIIYIYTLVLTYGYSIYMTKNLFKNEKITKSQRI